MKENPPEPIRQGYENVEMLLLDEVGNKIARTAVRLGPHDSPHVLKYEGQYFVWNQKRRGFIRTTMVEIKVVLADGE
jgi:hypothetical protein